MGENIAAVDLLSALVMITIGAFANASFGLFLKRGGKWRWEHMWLIYSVTAMLIIPWTLGLVTVPHLMNVLVSANSADLARIFLFGMGWGIGSVLYGIALKLVGLGLTYAIVMGLTASVGSLAPLVLLHAGELLTTQGALIVVGVTIVVAGVLASAWAGQLKTAGESPAIAKNFLPGLLAAVSSGVLSPMLNLSFAYGEPVAKLAVEHGTPPLFAANAIWAVALSAGLISNAGYCLYLIIAHRSAGLLAGHGKQYVFAAIMGILWSCGYTFYGLAGSKLGELAPVVGWPVMSSLTIISANFWGAVTGEWKDASAKSRRAMIASIILLCAGMVVIGKAASVK